jgi:SAM-dependent methyltransferase
MGQDQVFLHSESDRYFRRNAEALAADEMVAGDPILKILADAGVRPTCALEVGAANGYRLGALQRLTGCRAVAVEPSSAAIADGRQHFPQVQFVQALAHELGGFAAGEFDLVIASFVLHWVDRIRLFETAAALDRVLADGGHFILSDFLPERPQRVHYHHRPDADIWTYKQDYASFWTASALYQSRGRWLFDHHTRKLSETVPPEDRCAVTLFRKELGSYPAAELPHSIGVSKQ